MIHQPEITFSVMICCKLFVHGAGLFGRSAFRQILCAILCAIVTDSCFAIESLPDILTERLRQKISPEMRRLTHYRDAYREAISRGIKR